jgi:hypothetical protein
MSFTPRKQPADYGKFLSGFKSLKFAKLWPAQADSLDGDERHDVPAHHKRDEYLDAYSAGARSKADPHFVPVGGRDSHHCLVRICPVPFRGEYA